MDSNSFITPHRGPYRFEVVPQFWGFLEERAKQGVIASPEFVLNEELVAGPKDQQDALARWASGLKGVLFLEAGEDIQACYRQVVDWVQNHRGYRAHWVAQFLGKADPWLIAYAKARGGRIVTFETPQPEAMKPKIPDVAAHFGVQCINVYDMLGELGFTVGQKGPVANDGEREPQRAVTVREADSDSTELPGSDGGSAESGTGTQEAAPTGARGNGEAKEPPPKPEPTVTSESS